MTMRSDSWLAQAEKVLIRAGITTARLDALVLLEDSWGKDRAHILAHPEVALSAAQMHILDQQIQRRSQHVPLAYLRGKTEFYGRDFVVNEHVLEPRPESETMIELLKQLQPKQGTAIIDVGTGSGALAITAKLELPNIAVIAIDIDPSCLAVARKNAIKHGVDIETMEGDLVHPLTYKQLERSILLCNLPYVPDNFQINLAAGHEPRLAIFGGPDGLDVYRKLFEQLRTLERSPKYILSEALPPQHDVLTEIAAQYGYVFKQTRDFIQVFSRITTSS